MTALYSCGWQRGEGEQTGYSLPGSVHGHSSSLITKVYNIVILQTFKLIQNWCCKSCCHKAINLHTCWRLKWPLTVQKYTYYWLLCRVKCKVNYLLKLMDDNWQCCKCSWQVIKTDWGEAVRSQCQCSCHSEAAPTHSGLSTGDSSRTFQRFYFYYRNRNVNNSAQVLLL